MGETPKKDGLPDEDERRWLQRAVEEIGKSEYRTVVGQFGVSFDLMARAFSAALQLRAAHEELERHRHSIPIMQQAGAALVREAQAERDTERLRVQGLERQLLIAEGVVERVERSMKVVEAERDAEREAKMEARKVAERERDDFHRAFCATVGHDPERTSKMLLPWEAPRGR